MAADCVYSHRVLTAAEGAASLTLTVDQRFGSFYAVNIRFERR